MRWSKFRFLRIYSHYNKERAIGGSGVVDGGLSNTTKGGRNHRNWWREEKGQTAQNSSTQQIQEIKQIKPKKQRLERGTTPDFNQRQRHAEQEGTLAVASQGSTREGTPTEGYKGPQQRTPRQRDEGNPTASRMRSLGRDGAAGSGFPLLSLQRLIYQVSWLTRRHLVRTNEPPLCGPRPRP